MTPRKLSNTLIKLGGIWFAIKHIQLALMTTCFAINWSLSDSKPSAQAADSLYMNAAINIIQVVIGVIIALKSKAISAKLFTAEQADAEK